VLSSGGRHPYLNGHRELLEQAADVGLVVSELPLRATRGLYDQRRAHALLRDSTVRVVTGAADVEDLMDRAPERAGPFGRR
jgi:hypothetical protein